ncbi:MAG: PAS domain-containing protein, partial [Calditrichaeota bacterium]|nr:PAS domain-containing protein [Calditrichota bacterium]
MGNTNGEILRADWLLSEVIERIPAGIAVIDQDGRLLAANALQEELAGRRRESLIGSSIAEVPPFAQVDWTACFGTGAEQGGPKIPCTASRQGELVFATTRGRVRVWPIRDAGDLSGFLAITEPAPESDDETDLVRRVIAAFPHPIALVDDQLQVHAWSRTLQALVPTDEFVTARPSCRDLFCQGRWSCRGCPIRDALAGAGASAITNLHGTSGGATMIAWPVRGTSAPERTALVEVLTGPGAAQVLAAPTDGSQSPARMGTGNPFGLHEAALRACGLAVFVVDRSARVVDRFGYVTPPAGPHPEESPFEKWLGAEGGAVVKAAISRWRPFVGTPRPGSARTVVLPVSFVNNKSGAVLAVDAKPVAKDGKGYDDALLQRLSCFAELGAALAHEVNNALNAIAQRIDCLRIELSDGIDEAKAEAEVALVKEDVRRIVFATRELLQIASPASEEPSPVDVNSVVLRALATSQATAPQCSVVLKKVLQPDIPAVCAWETELERCIRNLVDNAVEAMGGEGTLTVATRWIPETGQVEVSVADT